MKGMFKVTVFLTVIAMMAMSAFATPTVRITSGAASCTLGDAGAASVCVGGATGSGDLVAAAGGVSGSFTVGVFTINVSTGITKPASGSASSPYMDLNTTNLSTAAGVLVLEFSETGFTGLGSSVIRFGGTTGGSSVTYQAYSDAGNALFATTTLLATSGPQGPGAYSGTIGGLAPSGTYSLTQKLTITHSAAQNSSSNNELSVPEPGILSLLGLGLAGLGLIRRRLS